MSGEARAAALAVAAARGRTNVRERHDQALYCCFPMDVEETRALLPAQLEPDVFEGRAWACVLVDKLDLLESWVPLLGFVNSRTAGWMNKVNVLCKERFSGTPGYLISSIYFEFGFSGTIRARGASITQKIPSAKASYSFDREPLAAARGVALGVPAEQAAASGGGGGGNGGPSYPQTLSVTVEGADGLSARISGSFSGNDAPLAFARFVVERPTKFLAQTNGKVVFASELGEGAEFSAEGCKEFVVEKAEVSMFAAFKPDLDACRAFLQPSYTLVDHTNTPVDDITAHARSS